MATANEIHVQSQSLLQELGIWKFTVSRNSDLFKYDSFLKEFLAFKIDMVQGFIEELDSWEKTGNEAKCKNAIGNAEFFLGQIQVLFDSMFADEYSGSSQDMEEEPIFTDYIPAA